MHASDVHGVVSGRSGPSSSEPQHPCMGRRGWGIEANPISWRGAGRSMRAWGLHQGCCLAAAWGLIQGGVGWDGVPTAEACSHGRGEGPCDWSSQLDMCCSDMTSSPSLRGKLHQNPPWQTSQVIFVAPSHVLHLTNSFFCRCHPATCRYDCMLLVRCVLVMHTCTSNSNNMSNVEQMAMQMKKQTLSHACDLHGIMPIACSTYLSPFHNNTRHAHTNHTDTYSCTP